MRASGEAWRKSTYSAENGCVEVAELGDRVGIRDSKDRDGPRLLFTAEEWEAFLAGISNGEFDLPLDPGGAR
jgi:Domain of unknown function (DUF397)